MPVGLFARVDENNAAFAGNVMLRRVKDFDWSSTSIGRIEDWPEALRSVCRVTLLSSLPTLVLLGREGLSFYNDAASKVFGLNPDDTLGKPVVEVLPGATHFCRRVLERTFAGKPASFQAFPINVGRVGHIRKAWFDLDFTPISDRHGQVHGVLVTSFDRTSYVQALHDLRVSREKLDLALASGGIVGTWEIDFTTDRVRSDARYARLHGVDPEIAKHGAYKDAFISGIHPDDREEVMAAFDQAKIHGDYRCEHRVVGFEGVRWIVASGHIRHAADGSPQTFLGTAVDVTAQIDAAAALAESEKRFRTYAETLPHVVFSLDKDGQPTYINRRWSEFTGRAEGACGACDWESLVHPEDKQRAVAGWRHALADGRKYEATSRYRPHTGAYRWMHVVAVPIRDADGNTASWIGTLTDVHETRLLEAERELVSRELNHRIKNFFAVAQSLIGLTRRESHTIESFADQLRGRLDALHRSYELIRQDQTAGGSRDGLSLHGLIGQLLKPYEVENRAGHISIEGDDIVVAAGKITAFSLILHELATNAVKYGALSVPDGNIRIAIALIEDRLRIRWEETGGTVPAEGKTHSGFGSRLMRLLVEGQLRGSFSLITEVDGMNILIEIPTQTAVS